MKNEKAKVLFIIPLVDVPTITSNMASYDILKHLDTEFTFDVDVLWGITANRIFYEIYSSKKKYTCVFYLGHGEKNRLMGNSILDYSVYVIS